MDGSCFCTPGEQRQRGKGRQTVEHHDVKPTTWLFSVELIQRKSIVSVRFWRSLTRLTQWPNTVIIHSLSKETNLTESCWRRVLKSSRYSGWYRLARAGLLHQLSQWNLGPGLQPHLHVWQRGSVQRAGRPLHVHPRLERGEVRTPLPGESVAQPPAALSSTAGGQFNIVLFEWKMISS